MLLVRYTDDSVADEKTRIIKFGRFAERDCKRGVKRFIWGAACLNWASTVPSRSLGGKALVYSRIFKR